MTALTATGATTVIATGFVAYGEIDPSEGRSGRQSVGEFSTVEEAIAAAHGAGVQGDPGAVSSFEWLLHEGGAVTRRESRLIDRRLTPEGYYLVGWLDLREYAAGLAVQEATEPVAHECAACGQPFTDERPKAPVWRGTVFLGFAHPVCHTDLRNRR